METSLEEIKDSLEDIKGTLENIQEIIRGVLQALVRINSAAALGPPTGEIPVNY